MFILLSETHTFMYIQVIICAVHFVDLSIFVILHLSKDITFNIPVWTVVYSSQICYPDYSCRGPTLQWKQKNSQLDQFTFSISNIRTSILFRRTIFTATWRQPFALCQKKHFERKQKNFLKNLTIRDGPDF
jgi:hypothetical protein